MVDTEGKSFENPSYEVGEHPAATSMMTATSAPDGTNKVNKHNALILFIALPAWKVYIYDILHGKSFRLCAKCQLCVNICFIYGFVLLLQFPNSNF